MYVWINKEGRWLTIDNIERCAGSPLVEGTTDNINDAYFATSLPDIIRNTVEKQFIKLRAEEHVVRTVTLEILKYQ